MQPQDPHDVSPRAEALYLRAYCAALKRGGQIDLDELRAAHPDLAGDLQRMHQEVLIASSEDYTTPGADAEPLDSTVTMMPTHAAHGQVVPGLLAQLLARKRLFDAYQVLGKIDEGGMGIVYRVWDRDLRRSLAMKVLQGDDGGSTEPSPAHQTRLLDRFLEEAQVTGQLDHPGVVPVHGLGVDPDGKPFFTMRLVRGETLRDILVKLPNEHDGWNQTRVVNVLLRVCETMAYAHRKKVIHRDLKPSNVMVGQFGETYVMDWGLARIMGRPDHRDLRLRPQPTTLSRIMSDRREDSGRADAPLCTMDGQIVGTPAYMPPEQAFGNVEQMGPASDVYAMGTILYELLTERPPYVADPSRPPPPMVIVNNIQHEPPTPVHRWNHRAHPQLVSICRKAMAREIEDRYPTMMEMARDIRAYLEHRVVEAHRTGPLAELKGWVQRNRSVAAALGVLILVLGAAGLSIATVERRRARETARHLDEQLATVLVADADRLWPVDPASVPAMDHWIEQARGLVSKADSYRSELKELQTRSSIRAGDRMTPGEQSLSDELMRRDSTVGLLKGLLDRAKEKGDQQTVDVVGLEIPKHEQAAVRLRESLRWERLHRTWLEGADQEEQRRLARLLSIEEKLSRLSNPGTGLLTEVERRRQQAASLRDQTIVLAKAEWSEAIAAISDPSRCPAYNGLEITPQLGVVPLGLNDNTGLWEFWHVLSGERPERNAGGDWEVLPETGIVLVLVPGSEFLMGAQYDDPAGPKYDPRAQRLEIPPHAVSLYAFFISKYEMTQEQWYRATGDQPSESYPGVDPKHSPRISQTHPVETVSWTDCRDVLARWRLVIPTEAQWEMAAMGGPNGGAWTHSEQLDRFANYFDRSAALLSTSERRGSRDRHESGSEQEDATEHDDGYSHHAPVDAAPFAPSPYGLHHILGNVREWTADAPERYAGADGAATRVNSGDGYHPSRDYSPFKTSRGGGFEDPVEFLRLTKRFKALDKTSQEDIGIRPARPLDR